MADPYGAYANPISEPPSAKQRKTEADIGSTEAGTKRTTELTPLDKRLRAAQVRALEAKNKAGKAKEAAAETAAKTKASMYQEDTNNVLQRIAEARRLVSKWSTGWGSMLSGIPETDARALKGLLGPNGTISAQVLLRTMEKMRASSSSGATGLGAMDKNENQTLKNSITNLDLGNDPEKVLQSLNDLERSFRRYAAITSGYNPDERQVAVQFGLVPSEDKEASGAVPPKTVGGTTTEENVERPDRYRGLNVTVSKMLREGRSAEDIRAYLDQVEPGLGAKATNLEWWEREMKKPDTPMRSRPEDYVDVETVRTKASPVEKTIGEVAQTPFGAAVLAGTDFGSGGIIPYLTSNPEGTRAALKASELEHPDAAAVGTALGGITGGIGLEKLAAKYGLKLGPATIAALQSGLYGYTTSEDEGLGAVLDAAGSGAAGYVGGKGGEYLGKGLGKLVKGVSDPILQGLRARGVPLTLGEILGSKASAIEGKLAQFPIVGPAISARLDEGTTGFNRAAFNETLADLGAKYRDYGPEVGARGLRRVRQNASQVFKDALEGVTLVQDDVFQQNLGAARAELASLPDVGPKLEKAFKDQLGDLLKPGRPLTGPEVQAALRKVERIGRSFKNNELYESSIAPRLQGIEDEIRGVVERQAPNVLPMYDTARATWRKASVLTDAVNRATKKEAADARGIFTPEELQAAGMANAEKYTGKGSSVSRGYPFQELAESGIDVLTPRGRTGSPYTLPLTTAGLVGGASYLAQPGTETNERTGVTTGEERDPVLAAMLGLGAAGLAGAPYSRVGQKMIGNMLLSPRGPTGEYLGALMEKYAPSAGAGYFGSLLGAAPTRGTPELETPPPVSFEPVTITPKVVPPQEEPNGLGTMPSAFAGAQIDPETNEVVLPDGTRIPLSDLAGATQ